MKRIFCRRPISYLRISSWHLLASCLSLIYLSSCLLPETVDTSSRTVISRPFIGHLHFQKTAGTSLNRVLARRYHAVCGHKGYSFDQLFDDIDRDPDDPSPYYRKMGFGADRVRIQIMEQRGLHNCALVSHEMPWQVWINTTKIFGEVVKILLVPYREPVDHFLSICNHYGVKLDDIFSNSCERFYKCLEKDRDRYSPELLRLFDKVVIYDYNQLHVLIQFLDKFLPLRAVMLPYKERYTAKRNISHDSSLTRQREARLEEKINACSLSELREKLRLHDFFHLTEQLKDEPRLVLIDSESLLPSNYL